MDLRQFICKLFRIPGRLYNEYSILFNRIIFYLNEVEIGNNALVYNKIYFKKHPRSSIKIGHNFKFTSGNAINPLCRNIRGCIYTASEDAKIIIGNNVGMSSACVWAKERISIGNNVLIGGDCILLDTDAHNLDYKIRQMRVSDDINCSRLDSQTAKSAPITIGNDVLIGTRCIILKGVEIGDRTIIGSGSVVTKSIPSDCIAAGNPCRIIRKISTE